MTVDNDRARGSMELLDLIIFSIFLRHRGKLTETQDCRMSTSLIAGRGSIWMLSFDSVPFVFQCWFHFWNDHWRFKAALSTLLSGLLPLSQARRYKTRKCISSGAIRAWMRCRSVENFSLNILENEIQAHDHQQLITLSVIHVRIMQPRQKSNKPIPLMSRVTSTLHLTFTFFISINRVQQGR